MKIVKAQIISKAIPTDGIYDAVLGGSIIKSTIGNEQWEFYLDGAVRGFNIPVIITVENQNISYKLKGN